MPDLRLVHAESYFPVGMGAKYQEWFLGRGDLWPPFVPPGERELPRGFAAGIEVVPRVEWGRWIVDCPFCPAAQFASTQDPRFFCLDCLHAGTDAERKWLRVAWPSQRTLSAVETALEARRMPNRNWTPGEETAADLKAENAVMRKAGML